MEMFSLVPGPVLSGPAGVALSSVGGRGVASEALLAEHGVSVVEEEDGVTGALDRGDLGGRWALAWGTIWQSTYNSISRVKRFYVCQVIQGSARTYLLFL